jgi:Tol biopolymer transport system component
MPVTPWKWIGALKPSDDELRPGQRRQLTLWVLASFALAAAGVVATIWLRQPPELPVLETISYSGVDERPAVVHDGKTIAYSSEREGGLYQIATLGGPRRKLLPNVNSGADWSPDGTRLAYVVAENGVSTVYIAGRDGGSPKTIASGHGASSISDGRLTATK